MNLTKTIPIQSFNDSLYVMTAEADQGSGTCFINRDNYWFPLFNFSDIEWGMEFFISPGGDFYIYDPFDDSLMMIIGPYFYESKFCPGRPVFDQNERVHIIEELSANDYVYIVSDDTLNTLIYVDTLQNFSHFQKIVSNPDNSMLSAVFFNFELDRIYKYSSVNGIIDFTNPTIFQSQDLIWGLYDMVLDDQNKVIAVVSHNENWWGYIDHYVWTEDFGFVFLNMGNDEAMQPVYYEISFSPNEGEIIIIRNELYPGSHESGFHYSSDGGNTWYRPLFEINDAAYGSSLRAFDDTLHFVYSTELYGNVTTYYYPIPVYLITDNLTSIDETEAIPKNITLLHTYPNPFNAQTTIEFTLASPSDVELTIYDITGAKVMTIERAGLNAGQHSIIWDAGDAVSGVYFARLKAGDYASNIKMVLLK